ncbi:unnamed protein product [Fraxinus pennsylvanica]|uniref:K+ potassium transporter integral membrane domain-containing protein n=1 Tax=Fraxinus pennsylvanica TaxID=56036 RepID=A0AAD1YQV5_9LAMI|nr:unnamed protein product [Fraxinus pennsylvanica]
MLLPLALIGTCMVIGDGVLTPAISVPCALSGLELVVSKHHHQYSINGKEMAVVMRKVDAKRKIGFPFKTSANMQPKDHMSTAGLYFVAVRSNSTDLGDQWFEMESLKDCHWKAIQTHGGIGATVGGDATVTMTLQDDDYRSRGCCGGAQLAVLNDQYILK